MAPEDKTDDILFARVFKGSAPIEVTHQPLHTPSILNIFAPPLPERLLTEVKGKIVQIETSQLPAPEEVLASLSSEQQKKEGGEEQPEKPYKGADETKSGKGPKR